MPISIEQTIKNETDASNALDAAQRALDDCADPAKVTRARDERDQAQAVLRGATLAREEAEHAEAARVHKAKLARLAQLRSKADRAKARKELDEAVGIRCEVEQALQRATGAALEIVAKHREAHAEATALAAELGVEGPALEPLEPRMADALYLLRTHPQADRLWTLNRLADMLGVGATCDASDYPLDEQIEDLLSGKFADRRSAIATAQAQRAAARRAEGERIRDELVRAEGAMNSGTAESKERYAAARGNWERHLRGAA